MHHLTADEQAELWAILVVERTRLERVTARTRASGPVLLDQTSVGRLSRMDALMNEGLAQSSEARAGVELAQVYDALSRFERGTYGSCLECHSPIPFARLVVMPESRTCARCS